MLHAPFLRVNSKKGISAWWAEIALVYTLSPLSQLATLNATALPRQSRGGTLCFPGLPRCHLVINDLTEYISLLLPGGPGVLFQSVSAEEKVRHMIREGTLGNGEKWPSLQSNRQRWMTLVSLHLLPVCNLIGGDTSD